MNIKVKKSTAYFWFVLMGIIAIGSSIFCLILYTQNQLLKSQVKHFKSELTEKTTLFESKNNTDLISLMTHILEEVEAELNQSKTRSLRPETINRISVLSNSFYPKDFNYVEQDTFLQNHLSEERGLLLLNLISLRIDSVSFKKILSEVSFARADLYKAELQNADLSGVNLMSASFKEALLNGANLSNSDLRGANFWGAKMHHSILNNTLLKRADFSWADLHSASLKDSKMDGITMKNAKLIEANLSGSDIPYSDLSNSVFTNSIQIGTELFGTDLSKSNLKGANLKGADLRQSNISEVDFKDATLKDTKFRETIVDKQNWISMLNDWNVEGMDTVSLMYHVIKNEKSNNYLINLKE